MQITHFVTPRETINPGLPIGGPAFELDNEHIYSWLDAPMTAWVKVERVVNDARAIQELGSLLIDGARCMVFLCSDQRVRACHMQASGINSQTVGHA